MKSWLCALGAWVTVGCVSSGRFEELEARHADVVKEREDSRRDLENCNAKVAGLEKTLAENRQSSDELRKANASQSQEVRKAQERAKAVEGEKARLEASAAEMQKALEELARRRAESEKRIAEYRALLSRFKGMIDAGKLDVKIVDGRMVVALPTDILFPPGSASLSRVGRESIREVAELLASIPERRFQVEGHTDDRPIGTAQFPSNWELAAARALSVVKTMVDARMPPERVSAASFSEYRPVADNADKEGRAANRRVDIVVEPDLSELPGFDELNAISGEKAP